MSYDEEQQRRSRVVVETPTARREESYVRTTRNPDRGYSTGMIATVALVAIAATALLMFFLLNRDDATNSNTNVTVTTAPTPLPAAPTPVIIQQPPAQQPPPIIVQAPPATTTTQPAPVIVTPPAPAANSVPPASPAVDDATIETEVQKTFTDDADLGAANLTVSVISGKATLIGSVKSPDLKTRAERLARGVRGVKSVDNKITADSPL